MQNYSLTLDSLPLGKKAKIINLDACGPIRRRMLDLGIIKDTYIEAIQKSPSGDPIAYLIRGALIAIRSEEAKKILIKIDNH